MADVVGLVVAFVCGDAEELAPTAAVVTELVVTSALLIDDLVIVAKTAAVPPLSLALLASLREKSDSSAGWQGPRGEISGVTGDVLTAHGAGARDRALGGGVSCPFDWASDGRCGGLGGEG